MNVAADGEVPADVRVEVGGEKGEFVDRREKYAGREARLRRRVCACVCVCV